MSTEPNNEPTKMRPGSHISSLYTAWRHRPLSGLRWQLTFVSSILLSAVVIVFSIWISYAVAHTALADLQHDIQEAALVLIALGVLALFGLINFLLRPLRHMTDAAQAITLGD